MVDGHVDGAHEAAVGGEAPDPSAQHEGAPHAPFGVHGGAVGGGVEFVGVGEGALVGEGAARRVVVVGGDEARQRVGKVKRGAVGAPARAVGARDSALQHLDDQVPVEPVELGVRRAQVLDDGAGQEAPLAVHLAVVETNTGGVDQPGGERLARTTRQIECVEAILESHHGTARLT